MEGLGKTYKLDMKQLIIILLASALTLFSCNGQVTETNQQTASTEQPSILNLNAAEFKEKIREQRDKLILDVRTLNEVQHGMITSAKHVDFYSANFVEEVKSLASYELPVFVYCKSGGRSRAAANKLIKAGYKEVYNLKGGFDSWKK